MGGNGDIGGKGDNRGEGKGRRVCKRVFMMRLLVGVGGGRGRRKDGRCLEREMVVMTRWLLNPS